MQQSEDPALTSMVLEIERRLRGPPLPERHVLEQILGLLASQGHLAFSQPPTQHVPPPPPRRGGLEVNTARSQQIRRLQHRMEHAASGGMGSQLAVSVKPGPHGAGEVRVAETFQQRAKQAQLPPRRLYSPLLACAGCIHSMVPSC